MLEAMTASGAHRGLRALQGRERRTLYLRFVEGGLTQSEIGERLGMSQMHVSRLIGRALKRVRAIAGIA